MHTRAKRPLRMGALAAPIVITAMVTPACEGRIYTNPGPPQVPPAPTATVATPPPDPTEVPPGEPVPTADPPEPTPPEELQPIPPDGDGRVQRMSDGSCLYIYPPPNMDCPPTARCNPGPPRKPLNVKCPMPPQPRK